MIKPIELEQVKYQVAKAEAQVAYQTERVRTMSLDTSPRDLAVEKEILNKSKIKLKAVSAFYSDLIKETRSADYGLPIV